ncbi:M15 family metallopeptidase [Nocardioides conyzicola]|uniref:D-alanyl-D-alanine carboxypeptidase-like core domain-containing protein n=1 Tax=Nocardioides conyzicola TaxID=1651781 RepID=A0ABP8XV80_9ACTN
MIHHRTLGTLAATLLVVAVAALACGTSEPSARDHVGVPRLRAATDQGPGGGPFDTSRPTIGNLDPDLLAALQAAAKDASDDGVGLLVTSGWRSKAHQRRLFTEAVSKYGSEEEARRYVSTPDTSAHVTGDAVDIGPTDADDWLIQHGDRYGLCQVFANEIWHFELATTPGGECPQMYADSSERG